MHQGVNKEEVTFVGFQIEDQLCSESERRDLKRPTPTSRETDEAAQAELETEAEAASSSFFHTEKAYKAFIFFLLFYFLRRNWKKTVAKRLNLSEVFWVHYNLLLFRIGE